MTIGLRSTFYRSLAQCVGVRQGSQCSPLEDGHEEAVRAVFGCVRAHQSLRVLHTARQAAPVPRRERILSRKAALQHGYVNCHATSKWNRWTTSCKMVDECVTLRYASLQV